MDILECGSQRPADVLHAHVELLTQALRLAEEARESWDCIRIAFLSYNGALRVSPIRVRLPFWYPVTQEDARVAFPGHFEELRGDYPIQLDVAALADAERADDDEDDEDSARHAAALARRVAIVREALADASLSSAVSAYFETARFGIQCSEEQEVYYECDFTPVLGDRLPLPPQPRSAIGVLARMLCQTHSYLGTSDTDLKWRDGKLVEATFSGADASDRTIALLDDVEDVAEVCASLQVLRLEATSITEPGRAKLARLLPHVDVKVVR